MHSQLLGVHKCVENVSPVLELHEKFLSLDKDKREGTKSTSFFFIYPGSFYRALKMQEQQSHKCFEEQGIINCETILVVSNMQLPL